ncbi:unnamed protein product [Diplocarpon coronariae]
MQTWRWWNLCDKFLCLVASHMLFNWFLKFQSFIRRCQSEEAETSSPLLPSQPPTSAKSNLSGQSANCLLTKSGLFTSPSSVRSAASSES